MIAPGNILETVPLASLFEDSAHPHANSSIRWFEDRCTVSPDWSDECYVNHSFEPNGLWQLGFLFALRDIEEDEEITMDYSHIIAPEHVMEFRDAQSGKPIFGVTWKESLLETSEKLLNLARVLSIK